MLYQIKRGNTVIWSGKAQGKQSKVIMQEDRVEITIKSPIPIVFKKGDTIIVYGETYKLNRPENIGKTNTEIGYTYTIEFEALYYDLGKWILNTLDKNNNLTEPDVYIMGEASVILGLLVQNANRAGSGWTLGQVDRTETIQWAYNGAKLLTVLQDVADQTNLEFWCVGKQINLTRKQIQTGITFQYGKGKGLYELRRDRKDNPVVTHMKVQGGTQNIPNGYGFRQIQPTGGNPMVNPNYVAGMEVVEDVLTFENVYPRLEAKVTSVQANNIIRSNDIDFNLNDYLLNDGSSAQIAFTSGLLNSFKFTISEDGFDNATKQVKFNTITDENAYPDGVPNAMLKPAVGDSFVFLNINMPQSYVTAAENRVKELGDQYFEEEGTEQYTWSGKITPKFILENNIELTLGGIVNLNASDIGFSGPIRIASYTRDLEEEYLYDFTLSNVVTINYLVRLRNQSDRLANAVSKGLSSDGLSTKSTYAESAGFATLAGHANTATNAATSNFANQAQNASNADRAILANRSTFSDQADKAALADRAINADHADKATLADRATLANYALDADHAKESDHSKLADRANIADYAYDSDKWDGYQFANYLDQPVRTNDDVRHQSISTPAFVSGATGSGWKLFADGSAEVDSLTVRKSLNVVQLVVREITGTGGSFAVTNVAKIYSVTEFPDYYSCVINTDDNTLFVPFNAGDIVRCQVWDGKGIKYYVGRIRAVSQSIFDIEKPLLAGSGVPSAGDNVFQFGSSVPDRQGLIYMTNSDSGAPYLDVLDGIYSPDLTGKTKVRLGKLNGITDSVFGALSGYGLYAQNAYLRGAFWVTGGNAETKDGAQDKANSAQANAIAASSNNISVALQALSVGGRNFVVDSATERNAVNSSINENYVFPYHLLAEELEKETEYTLSCFMWMTGNVQSSDMFYINDYGEHRAKSNIKLQPETWALVYFTFKTGTEKQTGYVRFDNNGSINGQPATLKIKKVKLEKGNKVTDWSPAPEDLQAQISESSAATKAYADAQDELKKIEANAYADGKVSAEEQRAIADATNKANAAKAYADAQDVLVKAQSDAYADGKVSAEEQARINQAQTNLQAAKDFAAAQDNLAKVETKAYADGIVDAEEARAIADAQAKLSEAKNHADAQAAQAQANAIASASQDATAKANAVKNEAISSANQFAQNAVDAIKVGGRNLLLNSKVNINTTGYQILYAKLSEDWIVGETYTVQLKTNTQNLHVFQDAGYISHKPISYNNGILFYQFKAASPFQEQLKQDILTIYRIPRADGEQTIVEWVKLEKGNKATDWTPAPEDIADALDVFKTETSQSFSVMNGKIEGKVSQTDFNALGQTVSQQATLISQNTSSIELRATKQEFSELNNTVGGLSGRVSSAETAIQQNSNDISMRAVKTEVDSQINNVNGLIDNTVSRLNEAELQITPDAINSKVSGQIDSKISDVVVIKDTREFNNPPSWYYDNYPRRTVQEFKRVTVLGLPYVGEDFAKLTTNVPWLDFSGGNVVQEAIQAGRTYTRYGGGDSWTAWIERESTNGAQDKANSAYNSAVTYANSQITQTKDAIQLSVDQKISNIQIGGRNLVINSKDERSGTNSSTNENYLPFYNISVELDKETEYTFSCEMWMTSNVSSADMFYINDYGEHRAESSIKFPLLAWYKHHFTFTTGTAPQTGFLRFDNNSSTDGQPATLKVRNVKLEKGNKVTDWTPAPEDVQGQIDDVVTRVSTAELKITPEAIQSTVKSQTETIVNNSIKVAVPVTKIQISTIGLDVNKYYPVNIGLVVNKRYKITIDRPLSSDYGIPSYGQHSAGGFSAHIEWYTNGAGWGEKFIDREIIASQQRFANGLVLGSIGQVTEVSEEIIYLRGGSLWDVIIEGRADGYADVKTNGFSWQVGEYSGNVPVLDSISEIKSTVNRLVEAETSITQTKDEILLRATKTEVTTQVNQAKSEAINTASSDATNKANNAQNNAVTTSKTYTDSQIVITNNAISLKAEKSVVDSINNRLSSAELKITDKSIKAVVKEQTENIVNDTVLANMWASGKPLNPDPTFKEGMNGLKLYNNNGTGAIVFGRLSKNDLAETLPTTSGYAVYYHQNGDRATSPGWGGFYFETQARAKAKFITRLILAFEEGRNINFNTNAFGDNGSQRWLTPTAGKGIDNFTEYISYVECGTNGTFQTTNFFSFSGGDSVSVRVAFAGVYDITDAVNNYTTKQEIASSFEITPGGISLAGKNLSLNGVVTFGSLDADAQNRVNTANNNATNAQGVANSANSTANTALTTAQGASGTADTALSTANGAKNTADTANGTANGALSSAQDANGKSENAITIANTANATANNANGVVSNLQASLKSMAFEDRVELAKLGNTVVNGGYLKTDLLNVNEIFAKNITASGSITATDLTVTGNSKVAGFKISGDSLFNDSSSASLIFNQLGGSGFLTIDGNSSSQLSIRTDINNRTGISVQTYAPSATGLYIINNASAGTGHAIRSYGSHSFVPRVDEKWNAPGVLGVWDLQIASNGSVSIIKEWKVAPLNVTFERRVGGNGYFIRATHNLLHSDFVALFNNISTDVSSVDVDYIYSSGGAWRGTVMFIGRNMI